MWGDRSPLRTPLRTGSQSASGWLITAPQHAGKNLAHQRGEPSSSEAGGPGFQGLGFSARAPDGVPQSRQCDYTPGTSSRGQSPFHMRCCYLWLLEAATGPTSPPPNPSANNDINSPQLMHTLQTHLPCESLEGQIDVPKPMEQAPFQ